MPGTAEHSPHGAMERHQAFEALEEGCSGTVRLHQAQPQEGPLWSLQAQNGEHNKRSDIPYLSLVPRRDLLFRQMSETMYRTFSLCFL